MQQDQDQTLSQRSQHRSLELSLSPISLWGLGDPTGAPLQDIVGARNGTYGGTVIHNALDLPQDRIDGAINFAGTGSGSIPHAATFALAAFTLSFWFRANTVPDVGDRALPLITKNAAAATAGDLLIYLPSNTGTILRVRFRDVALVNNDIDTPEGTILSNVPYHVCVRADSTGFDVFVNGTYYGKNTTYKTAWSANVQPLLLAASPTFTATGDCVIDEVALFNRILTDAEVLQLAERSGTPPVANDDVAQVPERKTTAILVLANDQYVGAPTIETVNSDGGRAVAAENLVNYTAPAVGVNTVRSFTYRITDPNGTSNPASVDVTVIADTFVPTSNANCYTIPGLSATPVDSMAALEARVNAATPGEHIVIKNDTYAGGNLTFTAVGTEADPIVIRGQTRGEVIINDCNWKLAAASSRLVFTNLFFNNPRIIINGTHHRITRCQYRQVDRIATDVFNATDLRVDHCDFSDYTDTPPDKTNMTVRRFFRLDQNAVGSGACKRILFDYNHVRDVQAHIDPSRDMECVGMSASSGGASLANPAFIIDHCLFDNISLVGDGEMIGAKTSGIKFRFCTVTNCGNAFLNAPRQAKDFEIRSCWFDGNQANFVRIASDNALVIGNRFKGNQNLCILSGTQYYVDGSGGGNPAARNARIIGNKFDDGQIRIGHEFQGPSAHAERWDTPVLNANICPAGSVGENIKTRAGAITVEPDLVGGRGAVGTTRNPSNPIARPDEAFEPAEEPLTPAQVGMDAPDPLCQSGPQT